MKRLIAGSSFQIADGRWQIAGKGNRLMMNRPYKFFWAVAIVIAIMGIVQLFVHRTSVFAVNAGDTYYVISYTHMALFFVLFYFTCGLIYRLFSKASAGLTPRLQPSIPLLL